MPASALSPVAVGLFTVLNVSGLTALLSATGIVDDVPPNPAFPFVLVRVSEEPQRGLGTGQLPEVSVRVHVFSRSTSMAAAQAVVDKVVELLRDQAVTVSGYTQAGLVVYDGTQVFSDQVVGGIKTQEHVAQFRLWVEA